MKETGSNEVCWQRDGGRVTARLADGAIVFDDSEDHWVNAVCRLLYLDDTGARRWIAASVRAGRGFDRLDVDGRIEALRAGAEATFARGSAAPPESVAAVPAGLSVFGEPIDCVWIDGIREDSSVRVAGAARLGHGVLVHAGGGVVAPAEYEEEYFEGGAYGVGYGDYREQMGWRLEKSARQVRQLEGIALCVGSPLGAGARVLDVGSGYGYFRKAAADRGLAHDGLDVSRHAAVVARAEFGYETFVGGLEDFAAQSPDSAYDLITLFDTIEHVADPLALVQTAARLLRPGGLLAVRTPNLHAVEREVFGRWYHSLKHEHLHYFSARSLCRCFELAGVAPVFLTTEAHLLGGALGSTAVQAHARLLRGSDLFAVARKER